MAITSINPATAKPIRSYEEMTPDAAAGAVVHAHSAAQSWRTTPFSERAMLMKKAASLLRRRKPELSTLMADEMGKPLTQGVSEVEKCAWACDYYADFAESHLAPDVIKTESSKSYVAFEQLGYVFAIIPSNSPLS